MQFSIVIAYPNNHELTKYMNLKVTQQETFAVIATSGRQYKIKPNTIIAINRINMPVGSELNFNDVLLACIDGVTKDKVIVQGIVLEHFRGEKIRIIKFKRRKHHLKRLGFRADLTSVKITKINEDI